MLGARVRLLNDQPVRPKASYVLYWAQMNRRAESNHGLEFAAVQANKLGLPVLFYEGLTCDYPHASDRFHTFVLEGVAETGRRLAKRRIGYVFHLRKRRRDPNDALYRLAEQAALVVTDDYPAFVAAAHNRSVPGRIGIPYFAVDSSCVVPMRLMEKKEYGAYTIRPKIHKLLKQYLPPVERVIVEQPWSGGPHPLHTEVHEGSEAQLAAECEIDHGVKPSACFRGGRGAGERQLRHFLDNNIRRYAAERNEPAARATSNLSPWLHFGHLSSHEVALAAMDRGEAPEFLEELIVRRELAFNHALFTEPPDALSSIPEWARKTLEKHAGDTRDPVYDRETLEQARTHDALWNATQKELLLRGKIHGYYRMYWGKKIIEWSPSPADALAAMVYFNDRYALDGRDPSGYTNILWCFGLHDRPWGERPVFGMVRYMSLEGMKRKTGVDAYLREISNLELTGEDPHRLQ